MTAPSSLLVLFDAQYPGHAYILQYAGSASPSKSKPWWFTTSSSALYAHLCHDLVPSGYELICFLTFC